MVFTASAALDLAGVREFIKNNGAFVTSTYQSNTVYEQTFSVSAVAHKSLDDASITETMDTSKLSEYKVFMAIEDINGVSALNYVTSFNPLVSMEVQPINGVINSVSLAPNETAKLNGVVYRSPRHRNKLLCAHHHIPCDPISGEDLH